MELVLVVIMLACGLVVHFALPAVYRRALRRLMNGTAHGLTKHRELPAPSPLAADQVTMLREQSTHLARTGRAIHVTALVVLVFVNAAVVLDMNAALGLDWGYLVGVAVFGIPYVPAFVVAVRQGSYHPAATRGLLSIVVGAMLGAVVFTAATAVVESPNATMLALVGVQLTLGSLLVWLIGLGAFGSQSALAKRFGLSSGIVRVWLATIGGTLLLTVVEASIHGDTALLILVPTVVAILADYLAFRALLGSARRLPHLRVLFLRTFARPTETDRLFRRLAGQLSFAAQVDMIAGADTASSATDPSAFAALLTGRLKRLFIVDDRQLEERLAEARTGRRNCDGRLPIRILRCFNDTWQGAVRALMAQAHVVIVDARGFSSRHGGLAYELDTIQELGLAHRALVITDDTTDWSAVATADRAPNRVESAAGVDRIEAKVWEVCTNAEPVGSPLPAVGHYQQPCGMSVAGEGSLGQH